MRSAGLPWLALAVACSGPAVPTIDSGIGEIDAPGARIPDAGDIEGRQLQPLVLALHGHGGSGTSITTGWHLDAIADRAVVLAPTGADRAWNSGASSCCLSGGGTVAELVQLVVDRIAEGDIDPARVYVWGQSNGGAMAWRLACAHPELFAAAVVQAGNANTAGDAPCVVGPEVAILQIHGTADTAVHYDPPTGYLNGMPEPYAAVTGPEGALEQANRLAGCSGSLELVGLVPITSNDNKQIMRWSGGCSHGYAEHWRFVNGGHSPPFDETWPEALLAWSEQNGR